MGNYNNSRVFNFVILLKLRKFDARKIMYVLQYRFKSNCIPFHVHFNEVTVHKQVTYFAK